MDNNNKKFKYKMYIDFDGVIANTGKAICDLYNEDYQYFDDYKRVEWYDIKTRDFEELHLMNKSDMYSYMNQPRMFNILEELPNALETIKMMAEDADIFIVTMGTKMNLELKRMWLKKHGYRDIENLKFIGLGTNEHKDKSIINMSDGIFIDDYPKQLDCSNANYKILFGDTVEYNIDTKYGRVFNWEALKSFFKFVYLVEEYKFAINNMEGEKTDENS